MKIRRESERVARRVATAPDFRRRRVLQGMLGGGVLAVTGVDVSAQQKDTLIALPRYALVIGNSQYKENPLRNPARDAAAMSEALERTGFAVSKLLDAGRDQMRNAIEAYGANLAKQGAVGLFYFAGHGMQLAWRNYLIPVDAVVDNPDDVRERGVDLNALLQSLTRAKNPMNVIILDACRDNPFGTHFTTGQKGLSQFDAPPGSLLAYATAPGNTAADGEGVNGLYTENLLREIRVADAKIEDVFKRVRLHVRRQTNGQQIPWESTSLEEDFYFVPPAGLLAAAEEEIARERKQAQEARDKQRLADEAETKRREDEARQEAQRAAAEAEKKRQAELAALEEKRRKEEAELERRRDAALKEAQRIAEEAERKRKEEEALRQAQVAKEEAERKYREELAAREKQLATEDAERKRSEEEARRAARLAQEETGKKRKEAQALEDRKREQAEADRRRAALQAAAPAAKPDARAQERQFEEELALWGRIKDSQDAKPFEDYLLRYPSGRYSELAQLQLDRILAVQGEKRIEIVSAADNPFTKGTVVAKTRYTVGDTYTYRQTDLYTKLENKIHAQTITQITDSQVIYDSGLVTDLLGNLVRAPDGRMFGPAQFVPLEYAVGKRWSTRCKITTPNGDGQVEFELHIAAREPVTVPAGTFNAFRIEGLGWSIGPWGSLISKRKVWVAPDVCKRAIASEDFRQNTTHQRVLASEREELVSFRQA